MNMQKRSMRRASRWMLFGLAGVGGLTAYFQPELGAATVGMALMLAIGDLMLLEGEVGEMLERLDQLEHKVGT